MRSADSSGSAAASAAQPRRYSVLSTTSTAAPATAPATEGQIAEIPATGRVYPATAPSAPKPATIAAPSQGRRTACIPAATANRPSSVKIPASRTVLSSVPKVRIA